MATSEDSLSLRKIIKSSTMRDTEGKEKEESRILTSVGLCRRKRICLNPTREFPVQPFITRVFVGRAGTLGSALGSPQRRQGRVPQRPLWVSAGSRSLGLRLAEAASMALPSRWDGLALSSRKHAPTKFLAGFRVSFAPQEN